MSELSNRSNSKTQPLSCANTTQQPLTTEHAGKLTLAALLRPQRWSWRLATLLGFVTLAATVLLLAFSGWFISAAAVAGIAAIQAGTFNYMRPGAMIRLLAITRTAGRYAERLQSHFAVLQLLKSLRLQSFAFLSQKPNQQLNYLTDPNHADLLQRLIADIDLLDQFPLKVWLPWCLASGIALCYLAAAGILLPQSLAGFSLLLLLLLAQPLWLRRYALQHTTAENQLTTTRRQQLLYQLRLLTTTLLLGNWPEKARQLAETDQQLLSLQQRLQRSVLLQQALQQALLLCGFLWLIYVATKQQQLTPAFTIALALGWLGLSELLQPLSQLHLALGYSVAAKNRYNELVVVAADVPAPQPQDCKTPLACAGDIAADATPLFPARPSGVQLSWAQVSAAERSAEISAELRLDQLHIGFNNTLRQLAPINSEFRAGDVVLLQGPSGLGKSCLLQTLAGDLTPKGGDIFWQGKPFNQLPAALKYQQIGYAAQRPYLFDLTVAANLRLAAPTATDDELLSVLRLVGLDAWLAKQPSGLATLLGQYGTGLSGGESRRLALARLLLQKPRVLLLDEPFAGLDQTLASELLHSLAHYQRHGILIIASHQQLQHPAFNRHWQLQQQ